MLRQGSVIQAKVHDPQGGNPKLRPLVVVTPTAEIVASAPLVAVAVTGTFSAPLAGDEVALPFHPGGLAKSGLRKPCVAKCSWLVTLQAEDVLEIRGFLANERIAAILQRIGKLDDLSGQLP